MTHEALEALTSVANWNDEGDEPIPHDEWQSARAFATAAVERGLPAPTMSPCGDGSIHFAWRVAAGLRVVVERKGGRTVLYVPGYERRECSDLVALERAWETLT
jgi:hypothetical protein